MAPRSPGRWLAPLALVAGLLAVVVVLSTSLTSDSSTDPQLPSAPLATKSHRHAAAPASRTTADSTTGPTGPTGTTSGQSTYTVQAGDILATVAAKTGVPVEQLRALNPGLNANAMSVGQVIKLEP